MKKLELNNEIRNYWGYEKLVDLGYKISLYEIKENEYLIKIKGNNYDVKFNITMFEDTYFVKDNNQNIDITEELDFTRKLNECIKSIIYYFSTRY